MMTRFRRTIDRRIALDAKPLVERIGIMIDADLSAEAPPSESMIYPDAVFLKQAFQRNPRMDRPLEGAGPGNRSDPGSSANRCVTGDTPPP